MDEHRVATPSGSGGSDIAVLGVRKRVESITGDPFREISTSSKRPRLSTITGRFGRGSSISVGDGEDRMIRPLYRPEDSDVVGTSSPRRHRVNLSISSSLTAASRASSPMLYLDFHGSPPPSRTASRGLIRTASMSSLSGCSPSPIPQTFPEVSAKHHLRPTKSSFDFALPPASETPFSRLLSCSTENTLFYTRGNRIYFKSLTNAQNADSTQLCKLRETDGDLRAMECGGKSLAGVLALATSQGFIQTWDTRTKKMIMSWPTTKEISALAWNGSILTVGGAKGTIRLYDTRISPSEKMKEQARKITRHQGRISCLSWNDQGKLLASGDSTGMVHCWEYGQMVPLNVGEFVQRRKKIQHDGPISAVAWSSWSHNLLATGDENGTLRLWNINPNNPSSNSATPGKVDTAAKITGIYFSTQCMEILTTHGNAISAANGAVSNLAQSKPSMANSLVVHTASLRHVTTLKPPTDKPIGDSVLNAAKMKVVYTVPDEAKINICDVWAKKKELRRQASFTTDTSLYIR